MKSFAQADRAVVQAMAHLRDPALVPLVKFINNLLEETKDALVHAEEGRFARLQGRAGVLEDFVLAVQKAPETLAKMRQ
jgi:flagellar hook-basal body complex protein FliE